MAYKVIILYRLYMPSYFLGTFTEYPDIEFCFGKDIFRSLPSAQKKEIKTNRVLFLFLFDDSSNPFLYRCQTEL